MLRAYIDESCVFEPEQVDAMSKAFDQACNALRIFAGDIHGRQVVATRIIDLASTGVCDPKALCGRVLEEANLAA